MRVVVGSDHAAYRAKITLLEALKKERQDLDVKDLGSHSEASVDYPDFARAVAEEIAKDPSSLGILLCGSGIGMAIAANKIDGVRAANVWDVTSSRLSREHNSANIICLGTRLVGEQVLLDSVRVFLSTQFLGGRHEKRIQLISALEGKG